MNDAVPSPADLWHRFRDWLTEHREALEPYRVPREDFGQRVEQVKAFQRTLHQAGWVRYGWPPGLGGFGGDERHRAAVCDALADSGYPPRSVFEHLDIIIPTVARFSPLLAPELVPRMVRGDEIWCQGFSEPEAGSDLAALRTRADRVGSDFVLRGHKIWTSWATWAGRCMLLARTGDPDARHRSLTMFVVDMDRPGLTARPIRQANGTPEFAEVFLDDVVVPETNVVGEVDGGWAVAMYLLSCERGSYPWQRHAFLAARFADVSDAARSDADHERLGHGYADLFAVRTCAWSTQRALARGEVPGPEAAVNKVLVTETEQFLYDRAREIFGARLETGRLPDAARWQEDYLYSRASSIYGGTRQIQLTVIARHRMGGEGRAEADPAGEEWRDSIARALRDAPSVREALDGLGWWQVSGRCVGSDGRRGFGALFETMGRELAIGPALGAVLAAPILEAAGRTSGLGVTFGTAVARHAGVVEVVAPGDDAQEMIVGLDDGWGRVACEQVAWRRAALDPDVVRVGSFDPSLLEPLDLAPGEGACGERALALGRAAVCFEILGASDVLLRAATEHGRTRRQFGKPLMDFQAVQHLLAEAHVEAEAIRALCHAMLAPEVEPELPSEAAALAKLRCGRAGRVVAQRCLQVFGAIGFTEEHLHHRYARRILTLDGFLGGASELARELGERASQTGRSLLGLPFDALRGVRA